MNQRIQRTRGNRANKIVEPCEKCGKKSHITQECYSGANWANRPQWWKNPKTTSPDIILIPPQLKGQFVNDNIQVTQPQYQYQATSQIGYQPPVRMTTQPQVQPQDQTHKKNKVCHIFSLGKLPKPDISQHQNTQKSTTTRNTMSDMNNHLSTGSEDGKFISSTNTTAKLQPKKTTHNPDYPDNPTDYNSPKRPLPESASPETYIHDPDFNCYPCHNPQIYDKTTLIFKQHECTPFEEYIRKTGMNISTEDDQDAERVAEIVVDDSTNRPKSILTNHGSQIMAPQSPPKDQPVNTIRAGILQSPTVDMTPGCHQTQKLTGRTTTEAVNLTHPTIHTETNTSKPQTRRIKRYLLLEPLSYNEAMTSPPPTLASPKMRSRTLDPLRLTQRTRNLIHPQVL